MRNNTPKLIVFICLMLAVHATQAQSGLQDFLKGAMKSLGLEQGLAEGEIVDGLKEALEIGTSKAVTLVSKKNGYLNNPKIKIALPEKVQKAESFLRSIGFGSKVDKFELSMNRAAERAAPRAKSIFWGAIKKMTFSDARQILEGQDDAATQYFQAKTSSQLQDEFKPIVNRAMSEVGVTQAYKSVDRKIRALPFTESLSFDLDQYVTDKALDGLFLMLAEEEKKIRQDPAARVTDLLKKVFAKQ
ncbi:hypothetical protein D1BOALGB6SA_711 [Olavius sp. associated proteobacterium Delta 1]|nr:hypothetical protein D1BOALGB6SA_711 [Olavius sp. associated proteobacterium Delta 1]